MLIHSCLHFSLVVHIYFVAHVTVPTLQCSQFVTDQRHLWSCDQREDLAYTHRNKLLLFTRADCKYILGFASRSADMSQWVKVIAAKPNGLRLIPETHMVEENWLLQFFLWLPHSTLTVTFSPTKLITKCKQNDSQLYFKIFLISWERWENHYHMRLHHGQQYSHHKLFSN